MDVLFGYTLDVIINLLTFQRIQFSPSLYNECGDFLVSITGVVRQIFFITKYAKALLLIRIDHIVCPVVYADVVLTGDGALPLLAFLLFDDIDVYADLAELILYHNGDLIVNRIAGCHQQIESQTLDTGIGE